MWGRNFPNFNMKQICRISNIYHFIGRHHTNEALNGVYNFSQLLSIIIVYNYIQGIVHICIFYMYNVYPNEHAQQQLAGGIHQFIHSCLSSVRRRMYLSVRLSWTCRRRRLSLRLRLYWENTGGGHQLLLWIIVASDFECNLHIIGSRVAYNWNSIAIVDMMSCAGEESVIIAREGSVWRNVMENKWNCVRSKLIPHWSCAKIYQRITCMNISAWYKIAA